MNMHSKNVRAIGRAVVSAVVALLCVETGYASSWYKGVLQGADPDVSIVMMRWGVMKDEGDDINDSVVGQIVAAGYERVTLVFEGIADNKKKIRVTFRDIPVNRYIRNSECVESICVFPVRHDGCGVDENKKGVMGKGFFVGKGCVFHSRMRKSQDFKRMRLVDVKSGDRSLHYFIKFNVSLDLLRSGMTIPLAKNMRIHDIPPPVMEIIPESAPVSANTVSQQFSPQQAPQSAVSQTSRLPQDVTRQQPVTRQTTDDPQTERLQNELNKLRSEMNALKNTAETSRQSDAGTNARDGGFTVTRISPQLGPVGQWVYVDGTFGKDGVEVYFNNVKADRVAVYKAGSLGVTVPDVKDGEVTVTVKTPDGQASYSGTYMVGVPTGKPKITGLRPVLGPAGQWVYIKGEEFVCGASTVYVDGKVVERSTVYRPDSMGFTIPDGLSGDVTVSVKTPNGIAESPVKFHVGVPTGTPQITGLNPVAGAKGEWVYIKGVQFVGGASTVYVNGKIAERSTVYGPDSMGFTMPDGLSGDVTVTVKTPNGTAESPIQFHIK